VSKNFNAAKIEIAHGTREDSSRNQKNFLEKALLLERDQKLQFKPSHCHDATHGAQARGNDQHSARTDATNYAQKNSKACFHPHHYYFLYAKKDGHRLSKQAGRQSSASNRGTMMMERYVVALAKVLGNLLED
jgi:hypothetical protein